MAQYIGAARLLKAVRVPRWLAIFPNNMERGNWIDSYNNYFTNTFCSYINMYARKSLAW